MIMKLLLAAIFAALTIFSASADSIEPEKVSQIALSNTDVNRIVCPYPISDVVYSQEKGITVKATDTNLFVKFPVTVIEKDGQEASRSLYTGNTELFLVCGEKVYTLIMQPKKMSAQTIYLSDTAGRINKSHDYVNSNDYDSLMLDLIQTLMDVRTPPGFVLKDVNEIESYRDISFNTVRTLTGGGYVAKEVLLRSDKMVSITDTEFLRLSSFKNVKAVALLDTSFVGITKAFVIEGVVK